MNNDFGIVSRVYVLPDEQGRVTRIEGEYSLPANLTDWVLIEEGSPCDRLNLAQSNYLDGGLYTDDGTLRWKLMDGTCVLRSDEEIAAEQAAMLETAPSQLDKLEAQVVYTAMMTDTLMET